MNCIILLKSLALTSPVSGWGWSAVALICIERRLGPKLAWALALKSLDLLCGSFRINCVTVGL